MLCIGLMSGTSADGMDACLADISDTGMCLLDALCIPYPDAVSQFLRALAIAENITPELAMDADRLIAQYATTAVNALLERNNLSAADISLTGSHGHTLRHRPQPDGFSWQIGDPAWIAEHTGITTIADFRRRDIAAGGEGAPLVPAFHRFAFGDEADTAVLNLGGIANLTFLGEPITGFDSGPGNALMDDWCRERLQIACDENGDMARSGKIISELLSEWRQHPYYAEPAPKSTGRETFRLSADTDLNAYSDADILCTLTELTATTVADAITGSGRGITQLLVCGGGVHNNFLMQRISAALPSVAVASTAERGLDPDWVEAVAFAWLGWRTLNNLPGNVPAVTGAGGERILGAIYPA